MSDLVVRDHSKPCEHGYDIPHNLDRLKGGDWTRVWICPGGREIVLRRATRFDGSITMENQEMYVLVDK